MSVQLSSVTSLCTHLDAHARRATCSLIYYALAFNTGTLHGNIYLNTFLSGALEIPAYIVSILMVNRRPMGRRWTGCIGLVGSSISSFLCIPMILYGQSTSNDAMRRRIVTGARPFLARTKCEKKLAAIVHLDLIAAVVCELTRKEEPLFRPTAHIFRSS